MTSAGTPPPSDSLATLRDQVKDVDDQILRLLAERLTLARAIGQVKAEASLPVKDYKVEKDVIERSRAKARELGLYETMAEDVARLLIKYAVLAQDEFHTTRQRQAGVKARRILIAGGRGRMGRWLSEYFESFGHFVAHHEPPTSAAATGERVDAKLAYPLESDFVHAVGRYDVVVLATPISATAALVDAIPGPAGASGAAPLVFDICSLKSPLLDALSRAAARGVRIASVHPMFGPGVELLAGRNILVCHVHDQAVTKAARALFEGTTATLVDVAVEQHDELMSYVLGLSHLVNLTFADVLRSSGLPYETLSRAASTTFQAQLGVVRPVANENQDLYYEIQAENTCTPALLAKLEASLAAYAQAIAGASRSDFHRLMDAGRRYLDTDRA